MDIGFALLTALRAFLGFTVGLVYELIAAVYSFFADLAVFNLFDGEAASIIDNIYTRVGLILSLFMIFKLTFSLIQTLINPDDNGIKNSGKLVTRIVVVMVLFATVRPIFNEARELQRIIVEDNVIYKIILGENTNQDDNFGKTLAVETLFAFFTDDEAPYVDNNSIVNSDGTHPDECVSPKSIAEEGEVACIDILKDSAMEYNLSVYTPAWATVSNKSSITMIDTIKNAMGTETGFYIEFDGWTALAVGIFMLYVLISYCLSVGVRAIQLAFLELIAPIPILSYLSIKEETAFNKWIKMCITTYVDLFIRTAIIYFAIYLIQNLDLIFDEMTGSLLLKVVIIFCILMFAKQAPKLLAELFPKSLGSIGMELGVGAKLKEMAGLGIIGGVVGAGIGAAGTAIGNAVYGYQNNRGVGKTIRSSLAGAVSGGARGARAGFKNGGQNGFVGMFKSGMQGVQGASRARNARDPEYGTKYGWSERFSDYMSTMTGQKRTFGAGGKLDSDIQAAKEMASNLRTQESFARKNIEDYKKDLINKQNVALTELQRIEGYQRDASGNPVLSSDGKLQHTYIKYNSSGDVDYTSSYKAYRSDLPRGATAVTQQQFNEFVGRIINAENLSDQANKLEQNAERMEASRNNNNKGN